jgi:hypothetical protein
MSESMAPRGIPTTPGPRVAGEVRRWRRRWLIAAGYDELTAHRLARRDDTDLHALLVQRERGVPSVDLDPPMRRHG